MSKKRLYSWDSSVFIAWLIGEETAPLGGIDAVADEIDSGAANLITSVVAYSEVLSARHSEEQMARFRGFLKRSNVTIAENTLVIAEKVGQIRSLCLSQSPKRKLKTPDATFIATAIIYKADVLHSTDPDILRLNGNPAVEGLRIATPSSLTGQGTFGFPS
ncbi:MAG: PIN domain-containing protein [Gemmataceae bacterium]